MNVNEQENWDPLAAIWDKQPGPEDAEFASWFRGLSQVQQILFPTHWLCCEVYNGGFHEYFTNDTGHHAPEAIAGFHRLDMNDVADLVQRSVDVFGEVFPRARADRESFLSKFEGEERSEWDPFFKLDDEFYEVIKLQNAPPLGDDDRFTVAAKELVRNLSN